MGKEILTLTLKVLKLKKKKIYCHETPIFLRDVDIEKVLVSYKISFDEKPINTLLVTCIMVIMLNH